MLFKPAPDLNDSDVTPKNLYMNRRKFLAGLSLAGCLIVTRRNLLNLISPSTSVLATTKLNGIVKGPFNTDEKQTPYNDVTHYNNFYEFGTDKSDPSKNAHNLRTSPWTVSVEGEVKKSRKFTMDEILKLAPLEERIYRHRCVEGWSIVVPWVGYPFNVLGKLVEPTPKAQYVPSRATTTRNRCRKPGTPVSLSPMWKACGSMKRCTHWRFSVWACMGRHSLIKTALRCGWWFPGSMASRPSSRSYESGSLRISPQPRGTWRTLMNTASIPT